MVLTDLPIIANRIKKSLSRSSIKNYVRLCFPAMGTECSVIYEPSSRAQASEFELELFHWLASFEARYSRYLPNSLVSQINRLAGLESVPITPEDEELFALCDWFYWVTQGIFDPTAMPLLALWDYHSPPESLPTRNLVEEKKKLVSWSDFERKDGHAWLKRPGMKIDLGGIGKEYAVDRTIELAHRYGIENILVNFGCDIRVSGSPPEGGAWRIGLENPYDPQTCWAGVALKNRSICTSGDYRRFFEYKGRIYGHIIDPRTGYPVNNGCRAATVIAQTCAECGVLSTTAFILGPSEGIRFIESFAHAEGCIWCDQKCYSTRWFHEKTF